jgi:hypothetical protein
LIIVERSGVTLAIKQLDHAALAGRFAAEWGNDRFQAAEPRDAVLLAAARHDEGWREWDDEQRQDPERGRLLNFLDVGIEDYVELYARGIRRIADLDPYAGVLVSMHGTGNVCGRWGTQRSIRLSRYDEDTWPPVIRRYVLEQERLQSELKLDLIGLNPTVRRSVFERGLWANYELLQAWDRLSLFLCRADREGAAQADPGSVPTSREGGETQALSVSSSAGTATVRPWPFGRREFEVEIPLQSGPGPLRWTLREETAA